MQAHSFDQPFLNPEAACCMAVANTKRSRMGFDRHWNEPLHEVVGPAKMGDCFTLASWNHVLRYQCPPQAVGITVGSVR